MVGVMVELMLNYRSKSNTLAFFIVARFYNYYTLLSYATNLVSSTKLKVSYNICKFVFFVLYAHIGKY